MPFRCSGLHARYTESCNKYLERKKINFLDLFFFVLPELKNLGKLYSTTFVMGIDNCKYLS